MKKIPKKRDLLRMFSSASEHWQMIGDELGVNHRDLMPMPGQALNNLGMVFDRWLSAYKKLTWRTICDLCEDWPDQLGQTKSKIETFLESERAHNEYGSTPDFDG